uniref:ADP-ribosyl cyclase/cyclic ADP-ribose hydrolase n=1 Tax=Araucaria cunninghamii TaxID=56994 RepID=A0A0D6QZ20_ARACU
MDGFNSYVPPTTKISFQSDKRFHVFLSFRGKELRETFVNHLYEALSAAGLRVFLDTKELKRGEFIDESLKAAIKSSAIRIPIFSKCYAESVWCLREATCMLEAPESSQRGEARGRLVVEVPADTRNSMGLIIPLFYDVEPTHVRFPQSDSSPYAHYFAKHYENGRFEREEIERWKQSLREISSKSGWSMELTGG